MLLYNKTPSNKAISQDCDTYHIMEQWRLKAGDKNSTRPILNKSEI